MRDTFVTSALRPEDMRYPGGLAQLRGPGRPAGPTLYVRGIFPVRPVVAIVGSREPCQDSVKWAREVAGDLARDGWIIGSGGAEGIDTAAHQGALDAGKETLVVTAGGLDRPLHPSKNWPLFQQVLDRCGALASLDSDGAPRREPDFLRRNHALASIAHAVIAVELKPRQYHGGTGHMARAALALGRPVMTLAHPPWARGGRGAVHLLSQGAIPVASSEDVRQVLQNRTRFPPKRPAALVPVQLDLDIDPSPPPLELGDVERTVIAALSHGPGHLDDVCERTGLCVSVARRALLISSLVGVVTESPSGIFAARPCG